MTRPAVCDDRMFEVLASVLETATKLDWIDVAGEPVLGVRESSM
ncbi:hypothetical protein Rpal_2266 [Rhodopseudomonas palustris TIE-1]|nr:MULTISPECIES: hypothetical protein [Rhodopseudomonas]ACF00787.1 hypothetical protein Rpal_2266 [Rhodopseudomonas palustris TIE-1]